MVENVWVFGHTGSHFGPLLEQFLFVVVGILNKLEILSCYDILFGVVAEKSYIRHQVNVWFPEAIFTLLVFEYQVQTESKLLPVTFLIFRKKLRVFFDNFSNNGVFLRCIYRHQHLVRDAHESLTMFDWFYGFDTDKASFKVRWVLYLGPLDSIRATPFIEHLALSSVFHFPVSLCSLCFFFGIAAVNHLWFYSRLGCGFWCCSLSASFCWNFVGNFRAFAIAATLRKRFNHAIWFVGFPLWFKFIW